MIGRKKQKVTAKSEERIDEKGRPIMRVKVYSPFKSYFDDMAYSISAVNHTGPFDILPRHHNFMTLIKQGELKITAPSGDQTIPISQGLMHVKADEIVVFLDI
jgi:F0F1-type ATP synthase epsilon subunit